MAEKPRHRAYWKGHLRLSLVTISVELFSAAEDSGKIALHQIHKPSKKRVRYEKVVPGVGPIEAADIVKGFEIEKDRYVILSPEELEEIKLESTHTIELVQFVDHCEIDPRYFDRPYYLVPEGKMSVEGFSVIRSALEKSRKVGLGQMSMRGREYLVAIKPCNRGMLLETLRYADEVRASDEFFDGIPDLRLDKEMLSLAGELIERKSKRFDAAAFHDSYSQALRALVEDKRKGKAILSAGNENERRPSGAVIDIMEALKKSVSGKKASEKGRTSSTARRRHLR